MIIAGNHPDFAPLAGHETQVWEALVSGNRHADSRLLSDDFLGVYPDGFAGKSDHTGQLADGPTVARFALDQLQARLLGADHAVLSYRATFTRRGRTSPEIMFVSSIWQRHDAGWINVFSQDTPGAATVAGPTP